MNHTDDLSDIDATKTLSVRSIRRIVRAAHRSGRLAMDHPDEYYGAPYVCPHLAVEAFAGRCHYEVVPACIFSRPSSYLQKLSALHYTIYKFRSETPDDARLPRYEAAFTKMLH